MSQLRTARYLKNYLCFVIVASLLITTVFPQTLWSQTTNQVTPENYSKTILPDDKSSDIVNKNTFVDKDFRIERVPVDAGAEIITIFVKLKGLTKSVDDKIEEVPMVSILRDTLGDETKENDRLRYVWMLTYTKPSFGKRIASGVPFLYTRTSNDGAVSGPPPPPVIDLNPTGKNMWNKAFWILFQSLVLDDISIPVKAFTRQYRNNAENYRKSAIARALAVLALYESVEGEKILTDVEQCDLQARLLLDEKPLGFFMDTVNLQRVYQKNIYNVLDIRGHNWELLRQYSEAQGLYFEPLKMPDGSATHALVWVAVPDLITNRERKYDGRFLNIKNPWNDPRLHKWQGYSEIRWFDEENRPVDPDTPNARPRTMIPLALYGLDYPKIPTLLVDFRDTSNPKKREMSKRVIEDLTKNVFSISKFSSIPYFVGRFLYDFATGRRGMDINQASRVRSYSQLKLLLSLNESLDPKLRDEIANRAEVVSLNPLENDFDVEIKIARQQYANLMAYAKRPDGLSAKIEKERREEMTRLKHGSGKRMLFALGHLFSLGIYTHREDDTPELRAEMDMRRRLDYHERFLRETARLSAKPEIDSDMKALRDSLSFISQNGKEAQSKTAKAIAKLFSITEDEEARNLCLVSLYRINNSTAKKELLSIYNNHKLEVRWRDLSANYLKLAVKEDQRIAPNDAKTIVKIGGQ